MKKRSSNLATGMAIGIATGIALGAFGAMQMPGVVNSRFMRNAKKSLKKNASKVVGSVESFIDSVPKMLG